MADEKYYILIDGLNIFKQLDHENTETMYSRLNVLVNEINSLGVKNIEEKELIHKMFHSLRRPNYDLVTTIIYEKELLIMTPNQVLNKLTAHELRNDIKSRVPPSSPTHSALTSKQERLLKKMTIKRSSSEEEEENESQYSSSDEEGVMTSKLYKQVKIMNMSLKNIDLMGYMVFLKDGPHHQLLKVEKIKFKKEKKEKKQKHEFW